MTDLKQWAVKAILLPLIPFAGVTLIRLLLLGPVSWEVIAFGELAIAMGITFLLLCMSAARMEDEKQGQDIGLKCASMAICLFLLFVLHNAFESQSVHEDAHLLGIIEKTLASGKSIDKTLLDSKEWEHDRSLPILIRVRWVIVVAFVISLIIALNYRHKYKLEA